MLRDVGKQNKEHTVLLVVVGAVLAYGHGDRLLDASHVDPWLMRHRREVSLSRLEHVADTKL